MMRDARTFTLHFRDDLYVERLAELALGKRLLGQGRARRLDAVRR